MNKVKALMGLLKKAKEPTQKQEQIMTKSNAWKTPKVVEELGDDYREKMDSFLFMNKDKEHLFNTNVSAELRNGEPNIEQKDMLKFVGKVLDVKGTNIPKDTELHRGSELPRDKVANMMQLLRKGEKPKVKATSHTFSSTNPDVADSYAKNIAFRIKLDKMSDGIKETVPVKFKYDDDAGRDITADVLDKRMPKHNQAAFNKGVLTKKGTGFEVHKVTPKTETDAYGYTTKHYEIAMKKVPKDVWKSFNKKERAEYTKYILGAAGTAGTGVTNSNTNQQ